MTNFPSIYPPKVGNKCITYEAYRLLRHLIFVRELLPLG
jgi:hypothetical protein